MSTQQIRINKTAEIKDVLRFLKSKYHLLSEADIMKLALSVLYGQMMEEAHDKSGVSGKNRCLNCIFLRKNKTHSPMEYNNSKSKRRGER